MFKSFMTSKSCKRGLGFSGPTEVPQNLNLEVWIPRGIASRQNLNPLRRPIDTPSSKKGVMFRPKDPGGSAEPPKHTSTQTRAQWPSTPARSPLGSQWLSSSQPPRSIARGSTRSRGFSSTPRPSTGSTLGSRPPPSTRPFGSTAIRSRVIGRKQTSRSCATRDSPRRNY